MGYTSANHRYQDTVDLTLAASAARTTTANGDTTDAEGASVGYFKLDVTAASGTSPTLDVTIQGQDSSGSWFDLVSYTQATGVTAATKAVPLAGRKVRAKWTVGGTSPSFTFSVTGEGKR